MAEYLVYLSPADEYLRAGHRVASRRAARSAAHRLLTNGDVRRAVARAHEARRTLLSLDADGVVRRFRHLYLLAISTGDLGAAVVALQNAARLLGLYDRAKAAPPRCTPADVDKLRVELRAAGFNLQPGIPTRSSEQTLPVARVAPGL